MYNLQVVAGVGTGRVFQLTSTPTIVGSGDNCSFRLSDPNVSTQHACFWLDASGNPMVEDLGSDTGVYIGGKAIHTPHSLAIGDLISLGDSVLSITEDQPGLKPVDANTVNRPAQFALDEILLSPDGQVAPETFLLYIVLKLSTIRLHSFSYIQVFLEKNLQRLFRADRVALFNYISGQCTESPDWTIPAWPTAIEKALVKNEAVLCQADDAEWSSALALPIIGGDNQILSSTKLESDHIWVLYIDRLHGKPAFLFQDLVWLSAIGVPLSSALYCSGTYTQLRKDRTLLEDALLSHSGLIGKTPPMRDVLNLIRKYATTSNAPLLIIGEPGTGKELTARQIHQISNRAEKAFAPIPCAALQVLADSDVCSLHSADEFVALSHPGGLKSACNGIVFFDEISAIPLAVQADLCQKIAKSEAGVSDCDIRYIFATRFDPDQLVKNGQLNTTLSQLLSKSTVTLPPLRKRPGDIEALLRHFVRHYSRQLGLAPPEVTQEIVESCLAYKWPGNVRELRNQVEQMVMAACDSGKLPVPKFSTLVSESGFEKTTLPSKLKS